MIKVIKAGLATVIMITVGDYCSVTPGVLQYGCWAAALAEGGVLIVGGAVVSGAGRQPWPRGWLGCW